MFKQVHQELKQGKRRLLPFSDAERNLKDGNFYLVDGLLAYLEVSEAEKVVKPKDGVRLEGRTATIFENGTFSSMLIRSLGKAIHKNGTMIPYADENQQNRLFKTAKIAQEGALQSGWIYVPRSSSSNPEITGLKTLYKL